MNLPDADDIATAARYAKLARRLRPSPIVRLLLASLPLALAFLIWLALALWAIYVWAEELLSRANLPIVGPFA